MLFKQLFQEYTNFLLGIMLVTGLLFLFGIKPCFSYYFLPILVIPLMLFAAALGLAVSIINAVSMDIEKIFSYIITLWMFLTPVVYSANNKTGIVKKVIEYNPLTYLHGFPRDMAIFGSYNEIRVFIYLSAASFLFLLFSMRWFYYSRSQSNRKNGMI
jgi:ABC-type polysaccharide/polyol phosphate export permease